MTKTRSPKQRDKILAVLKIEPRTITMLEQRTGINKRQIRKLISDMRADHEVYAERYEIVDYGYVCYYAVGSKRDATMPGRVAERRAAHEASIRVIVERKKKPQVKRIDIPFDPAKPVQCYGIWRLA